MGYPSRGLCLRLSLPFHGGTPGDELVCRGSARATIAAATGRETCGPFPGGVLATIAAVPGGSRGVMLPRYFCAGDYRRRVPSRGPFSGSVLATIAAAGGACLGRWVVHWPFRFLFLRFSFRRLRLASFRPVAAEFRGVGARCKISPNGPGFYHLLPQELRDVGLCRRLRRSV